ncbi:hypothetical protein A8F47_28815 [Burkholderia cenocepacia]|nr:hypothetical protein A8F47_28815 [Burkholderia cenocepacia]
MWPCGAGQADGATAAASNRTYNDKEIADACRHAVQLHCLVAARQTRGDEAMELDCVTACIGDLLVVVRSVRGGRRRAVGLPGAAWPHAALGRL